METRRRCSRTGLFRDRRGSRSNRPRRRPRPRQLVPLTDPARTRGFEGIHGIKTLGTFQGAQRKCVFEDEDDDENEDEMRSKNIRLLLASFGLSVGLFSPQLPMPETGNEMIVYHPHGLHKRVASGWAKKVEAICL
jgi:hypothetical protein